MSVKQLQEPEEEYKQKDQEFQDKDSCFESLVAKQMNETLTSSQFFHEVVKKHNEYDLPKEFHPEESDCETDSEEASS